MDLFEAIKTRRSRRLFIDKEVPNELLSKILEAGIHAPSSRDSQPWAYVIVDDKNIKSRLAELKTEDNQQHILTAPVTIVVCADIQKSPKCFVEDCVASAQNMLLAAHSFGLGAVYITAGSKDDPQKEKVIKELLDLPEYIYPLVLIPIGYADKNEKIEKKKLIDFNKITFHNKWKVNR